MTGVNVPHFPGQIKICTESVTWGRRILWLSPASGQPKVKR